MTTGNIKHINADDKLCHSDDNLDIRLYQRGPDNFAVVYGLQVDWGLTYSEACGKLGQAYMHALARESKIDNSDL